MKNYPGSGNSIFYVYTFATAVFLVHVCSQNCTQKPEVYFKVFVDRTVQEDEVFTRSGVDKVYNCLETCVEELGKSCIGFTFNEGERACKGYNQSLVGLTEVTQIGSVGYSKYDNIVTRSTLWLNCRVYAVKKQE